MRPLPIQANSQLVWRDRISHNKATHLTLLNSYTQLCSRTTSLTYNSFTTFSINWCYCLVYNMWSCHDLNNCEMLITNLLGHELQLSPLHVAYLRGGRIEKEESMSNIMKLTTCGWLCIMIVKRCQCAGMH